MVIQKFTNKERNLEAEVHDSKFSEWYQVILLSTVDQHRTIIKRDSKYHKEEAFTLAREWVGHPTIQGKPHIEPVIKTIHTPTDYYMIGNKVPAHKKIITEIQELECSHTPCFGIYSEGELLEKVYSKSIIVTYIGGNDEQGTN